MMVIGSFWYYRSIPFNREAAVPAKLGYKKKRLSALLPASPEVFFRKYCIIHNFINFYTYFLVLLLSLCGLPFLVVGAGCNGAPLPRTREGE